MIVFGGRIAVRIEALTGHKIGLTGEGSMFVFMELSAIFGTFSR